VRQTSTSNLMKLDGHTYKLVMDWVYGGMKQHPDHAFTSSLARDIAICIWFSHYEEVFAVKIADGLKPEEIFDKLKNTGNIYSSFYRGRKFVYFSTGGWSENEELIAELEPHFWFSHCLIEWRKGGHYKFKIPEKKLFEEVSP
jgi:hypothetical protein